MDNSLVHGKFECLGKPCCVLILVVMDNSLVHPYELPQMVARDCLNPCCNGQ